MTAEQKKSGFSAFFSRTKKVAKTELNELAENTEKFAKDAGRKVGAAAADVKHEVVGATKKVQATAKKTVKTAKTTAKKTVAQAGKSVKKAETAVKKATKPAVSAVKVRTGKPDATWSVSELKAYAKNKGMSGYSSLGKPELLALVTKAK